MKSTKKIVFLILIQFCLNLSLVAQIDGYLEQANRLFQNQNYQEAIKPYREVLILDKRNTKALYSLGICLLELKNIPEAQLYFDSLNQIAPNEFDEFDFWRGKTCYLNTRFHESYEHLKKYETRGKNKKLVNECINLIQFVKNGIQISKKENSYKIEHINQQINSEKSEFGAVASQNGKRLIFTRQNQEIQVITDKKKRGAKKEILISKLQTDDTWSTAERINNRKTSSGYDVAIQLLDADRRMLIYQDGDLKISELEDGEWKIPKLIKKGINTPKTEKFACVYDNGNKMIFSSDHGKGKSLDLFQTTLQKDGSWSKPIPIIELNTKEDEDSPYITNGGKTLYFSSKGHQNIGGFDIFTSNYNPVAKKWSKPKNLGIPINSVWDDLYFSITDEIGYLTSNRSESLGMEDIFRVYTFSMMEVTGKIIYRKSTNPCKGCLLKVESNKKFYEATTDSTGFYEIKLPFHQDLNVAIYKDEQVFYEENNQLIINPKRPKSQSRNYYIGYDPIRSSQIEISGKIVDKKDKNSLSASVSLIDISTGKIIEKQETDSTEKYNIIAENKAKKYRLEANKQGYFYATKTIDTETARGNYLKMDFELEKLQLQQIFILKNVYFETGSDILTEQSFEELDRLGRFLAQNPNVRIEISGHTDNIGSAGSNLRLSDQRAKAVQNYFVGKRFNISRLEAIGYGDTRPIASNDDEIDGRELNRRIEVQILEM